MTYRDPRIAFNPAALLDALERKRGADDITWRELARRCGMPQAYGIGAKLRAGVHPSAGVLVLLLAYLGETDLAPYIGTVPAAGGGAVLDQDALFDVPA